MISIERTLVVVALACAGLLMVACGGGGDDAAPVDPVASSTSSPSDSAGSDDGAQSGPDDGVDTGGDAGGPGGGAAAQGLVEELGLPECPVGAHLDGDEPIEIDFWHPYTALTEEAMQDLAARFNASQDRIVVTVEAQGGYGELLSKYRESISFDDLPAIAVIDEGAFRDVVDSGTVLPAQSCVEAEGFDLSGYDELVRRFYSIDGALYPAAMNVSTPVLYYNRDHFEAAGLDPDDPPSTLAELRDAAQAIKDAGVAATPLSLKLQGWYVETWLTGAGVPIVDADNGRSGNATTATFATDDALEIYSILDEMDDAGLIVEFSNTPGQVAHYLAAATPGTASMIVETSTAATTIAGVLGGTSNLSELVESAGVDGEVLGDTDLSIDIDVAPMPGLRAPGRVFVSGGAFYMANSGSAAERAAAWEFLKFVGEPEQQKIVHLKGSYLPIREDVLRDPDVAAVWTSDAAGQWLATAHAQLADIDPDFPGPAIGPFEEQRAIFDRSLEELLLGDAEPADVLAEAEAALTEALADYADANF